MDKEIKFKLNIMLKDFNDIENDMIAKFIDGLLSHEDEMLVTTAVRTYRDLWLLSNMYNRKEASKKT